MSNIGTRNYTNNGGIVGPDNDPAQVPEAITIFTSPGTFNPAAPTGSVLIIGGGGGGGPNRGGGGGAGGVLYNAAYTFPGSPVSVSIGGGGANGNIPSNTPGSTGGSSSFNGVTAPGGGYGAGHSGNSAAGPGGSGGGARRCRHPDCARLRRYPRRRPERGWRYRPCHEGRRLCGAGPQGGIGQPFNITSPTASPVYIAYASGGTGGNGGGASFGGGVSSTGPINSGGGGGSHGPSRGYSSGQSGYVAVKEAGYFAGAPGIWRLNEVYELIKDNNWSSS